MDRRQLLTRLVQGFSLVGAGFLAYPFLKAFLPAADKRNNLEVNVGSMRPGEFRQVTWQGRPIIIVRRDESPTLPPDAELKDPDSSESNQPAFAASPTRSIRDEFFVAYGNCTHLGCEVRVDFRENGVGFVCPCHRSQFDQSGRVYKDAIALTNLEVPDYRFLARNIIEFDHG